MMSQVILYSRKDCCLCDEMKAVVKAVAARVAFELVEVDIDSDPETRLCFNDEVPVLFINGRKAFKYRVSARELEEKLGRRRSLWSKLGFSHR